MATTQSSKLFKTLVVATILLMTPLVSSVWAKNERSKSDRSGNDQRVNRADDSTDRPQENRINQIPEKKPQDSRMTRPQSRVDNPSPDVRPAPSAAPEAKPNRSDFRHNIPQQQVNPQQQVQPQQQVKPPADVKPIRKPDVRVEKPDRKPDNVIPPVASGESRNDNAIRPGKEDRITAPSVSPRVPPKQNREQNNAPDRTIRTQPPTGTRVRENKFDSIGTTPEKREIQQRHQQIGHSGGIDFVRSQRNTIAIGGGDHDYRRFRPASNNRIIYEDRNWVSNRRYNHDYAFRDRHNRICNQIIWPGYNIRVSYNWGHRRNFHCVYPFYHRRYVFVSLGGFWPDYSCVRYYWYPAHSYGWYGYAPVAQEVSNDTYNYYTYNYYGQQTAEPTAYSTSTDTGTAGLTPVDADTFADVREKLSRQQPKSPDAQTPADTLFDEGVAVFGRGSYAEAADKFAGAIAIEPNDMILPFAYAQSLLAQGKYAQAAEIIRLAIQKSSPQQQGVYFPRGLYLDENTLMEQIDRLAQESNNQPANSDLQLLLGYQWLGLGETDKAIASLQNAGKDSVNASAASTLLGLAEQIKAGETQ